MKIDQGNQFNLGKYFQGNIKTKISLDQQKTNSMSTDKKETKLKSNIDNNFNINQQKDMSKNLNADVEDNGQSKLSKNHSENEDCIEDDTDNLNQQRKRKRRFLRRKKENKKYVFNY